MYKTKRDEYTKFDSDNQIASKNRSNMNKKDTKNKNFMIIIKC